MNQKARWNSPRGKPIGGRGGRSLYGGGAEDRIPGGLILTDVRDQLPGGKLEPHCDDGIVVKERNGGRLEKQKDRLSSESVEILFLCQEGAGEEIKTAQMRK